MQIVIDEASGVLKIQTLRKHVGRNENSCLRKTLGLERSTRRLIVVRSKLPDDFSPIPIRRAIHFINTSYSSAYEFLLQKAGRRHVFGKNQNLMLFQYAI